MAPQFSAARLKASIRLPRTSLPMRPPPHSEPLHVDRLTTSLYRSQWAARASRPLFHLLDGPPYANGSLHMGHLLNKVVKDIANRWKLLAGHALRYEPGWDCHGLPIELKALAEQRSGGMDGGSGGAASAAAAAAHPLPPLQVRRRAAAFATAAMAEQAADFQRWGVLADWELGSDRNARGNAYATMDPAYEAAQLRVFATLLARGAVHRALRPVHWSPASRTALAEAELEYVEAHSSRCSFVAFPLGCARGAGDGAVGAALEAMHAAALAGAGAAAPQPARAAAGLPPRGLHAVVWTTTPWTLPANVALALHPDLEYCVFAVEESGAGGGVDTGSLLCVAAAREGELARALALRRRALTPALPPLVLRKVLSFPGRALLGATFVLPFPPSSGVPFPEALTLRRGGDVMRAVPTIIGAHVRDDAGTGLVHTAPGHGVDDFAACNAHNAAATAAAAAETAAATAGGAAAPPPAPALLLPVLCAIDGAGALRADVCGEGLAGLHVLGDGASLGVERALEHTGCLLATETCVHRYPYDWRTKTPVLTLATEQWFVDVSSLLGAATGAVEGLRMTPSSSSKPRLLAALKGRTAWCISRQRCWGVPIPAYYRSDTGAAVMPLDLVERVGDLVETRGSGVWWEASDEVLLPEHLLEAARAGGYELVRGMDTLDVWFDSGTAWAGSGGWGDGAGAPPPPQLI